jgi:signal transduction histidine kinase
MQKVTDQEWGAPGAAGRLAVVLGAVIVAFTLVGLAMGLRTPDSGTALPLGLAAVALAYAISGAVLASRRPGNAIGWLMIAIGMCEALLVSTVGYAFFARQRPSMPLGEIAAWMGGWVYIPGLGLILTFLLLLYPTGHPPTPRWRWVGWVAVVGIALAAIGSAIALWDSRFAMLADPNADIAPSGTAGAVAALGMALAFGVAGIAAIVSLVVRWRRSTGDERQQLRWFLLSVVVAAIGFAASGIDTSYIILLTGMLLIPVSIAVAVLKYRLYDLDIVIRKTAIYAVMAALLLAVFGLVTWGATRVFSAAVGDRFRLIAGIAVGALIWPMRSISTRIADRLVYGGRATPYEVLSRFTDRIGTTYADDDVTARMATLLREATAANAARVWLAGDNGFHLVASSPETTEPTSWPADGAEVRYQGELLGGLSIEMPANDPMDAARARLVRDLAGQAGPVLANVRLIEELRASRRRIVAAQDERAKKLERDIHDGAQQQLVALTVKLRLLEQIAERDGAKAKQMAGDLQTDATAALEDLRDLARGIYPPLLADKGLGAALEAQARKAVVSTTVSADGIGRFPQDVESAVYFSCLEALQNIAKYAEASQATIVLTNGEGTLRFTVTDDGSGFDASTTSYGTGLQGIADRLAAMGGLLMVTSAPGKGTMITGTVPT